MNLHAILREYHKCSGILVLCNTSEAGTAR
jgi:predicted NodU family carbamoyl transferase